MYRVAVPRPITRESLEHGGATTYRWEPTDYYGTHPTRLGAKRAFIEALWPDLKGTSDAYIARFWRGEPVQAHRMKILKVEV
jgi:hypothetical protein